VVFFVFVYREKTREFDKLVSDSKTFLETIQGLEQDVLQKQQHEKLLEVSNFFYYINRSLNVSFLCLGFSLMEINVWGLTFLSK